MYAMSGVTLPYEQEMDDDSDSCWTTVSSEVDVTGTQEDDTTVCACKPPYLVRGSPPFRSWVLMTLVSL